jgi:chaperonin cofactor prefoldin
MPDGCFDRIHNQAHDELSKQAKKLDLKIKTCEKKEIYKKFM